jgi:hypothetical protein
MNGVGLDIGTMNLVASRKEGEDISQKRMRDLFLDLPISAKKVLKLSGASFIEKDDEIYLLGDDALDMASIMGKEARRPLKGGLIASGEMESLEVLSHMLSTILGKPRVKKEHCFYSIPANPVDADTDNIYHKRIFERILSDLGYEPTPSNEAMAIIYSNAAKSNFSGLSFSFGSGMTNVALAYQAMEGMSFSVAKGGDWIDSGASKAMGINQTRICTIKEQGIDLNNPKSREEEAICVFYKELIEYALDWSERAFVQSKMMGTINIPIPIIISGGTSTAGGFLDFFKKVFDKKKKRFPLKISEIVHAKDPFNAVADGLLIQALQEHEDD